LAQQPKRRGCAIENRFYVRTRGPFISLFNTGAAEASGHRCVDTCGAPVSAAVVAAPTAPTLYHATKQYLWYCCSHQGIRRSTKQNILTSLSPSVTLFLYPRPLRCTQASANKEMMRGSTGRRRHPRARERTFCSRVSGAGDFASGAFSSTARAALCRCPA
jgi:hypothetical protein